MSGASVHLSDEMVSAAVTKAILEGITGEQKEAIIGAAVKSLLDVPSRGQYSYGDKRTRLQEAFDEAFRNGGKYQAEAYASGEPQETMRRFFAERAARRAARAKA